MKLNSFTLHISCKHSTPLKTEQQQKIRADVKREAMGGRTQKVHLQTLTDTAMYCPKYGVRPAANAGFGKGQLGGEHWEKEISHD